MTNSKNGGVTKLDLDNLKSKLQEIYKGNKILHVSVNSGRTKLTDIPSTITGIYNHFFCVTAHIKNYKEEPFTINFIDVLIGKFIIREFNEVLDI